MSKILLSMTLSLVLSMNSALAADRCSLDVHDNEIETLMRSSDDIRDSLSCEGVPAKFRRQAGENEGSNLGVHAYQCVEGIIRGALANGMMYIEGIWEGAKLAVTLGRKFGEGMVQFLRAAHAGTLATFWVEYAIQGQELINSMVESIMHIPETLAQVAATQMQSWRCLNNLGRTQYICKTTYRVVGLALTSKWLAGKLLTRSAARAALRPVTEVLK